MVVLKNTVEITVSEGVVEVDGVSIVQNDQSLEEGDSVQLSATVTPEDATNKDVTWESDYGVGEGGWGHV